MRLVEALEQTATGALRHVASAHGLLHDDSSTRDELIQRLEDRLSNPTYLHEQLQALSDDERAVLLAARAGENELRGFLIDRDYPGAGEALVERGLLFRVFAAAGPMRGEVFVAPDELMALLPSPPAAQAPPADEPAPAASERRASDPAFSLFALVSALIRPSGKLEDDVRAWSEEPGGWLFLARWQFLQHLAQAAGLLVHRADGALAAGPTLARLLDDPPALADRLWRTYVRDRGWSELSHAGLEQGEDLADSVPLRQAVIEAVEQLPEGAWISLDTFSSWVRTARPLVVREQLNQRGLVLLDGTDWQALEHVLLRYVLLGPLYWLGVIGTSADGRHIVRRAAVAGRPGASRRVPSEPCVWEAPGAGDGDTAGPRHGRIPELVAPTHADLGTLLEAERYLVLVERGRPSRYHLLQSHVAAELGTGGSLADCRRLLLKLTRGPLPDIVQERLNEWQTRFGAVSVRPAVLVEARSEAELDEVVGDERVRRFLRARLGPLAAEVAAADALELAAALRESGHLPRLDAALRLASEPRRAYAGLVDEQVLEFLLISLLAFQRASPEHLGELEGASTLLERLERQFPPERLSQMRGAADRLAGELGAAAPRRRRPKSRKPRSPRQKPGL